MMLSLFPYHLQFKYPFRIAHGLRTGTDVVYVKLEHEGFTSWGEATLPPYLPETQKSVTEFLKLFSKQVSTTAIEDWFEKLSAVETDMSAKAALDMALWSLKAQLQNKTVGDLLGVEKKEYPEGYYTIGVCSKEDMMTRVEYALGQGFKRFKLKLDGVSDIMVISNFTSYCNHPFAVDVNSGWQSIEQAKDVTSLLQAKHCDLIEQPFNKEWIEEVNEFRETCQLDMFADESCQRLSDIERLRASYDGINIKLMKCGGITEALKMISKARELEMKILIGCMSESSVGCTAAAHLTPLADCADLDGPYLIANDPFEGMKIADGRIQVNPLKQTTQL
ncbi:MAG TPA: dipeptide epimerase [Chitinophagales bacterium]|nr:dipeptide epimerase [Chitinophagales bacterium]